MDLYEERAGVLVVRIWDDGDDRHPFRGRVTTALDVKAGQTEVTAVTTCDNVLRIVSAWLDAFLATRERPAATQR